MIEHPLLERNVPETKKHRIFKIFHKIIRDYSVPNNLYIFFLIFEGLQMLFYAIHPTYLGLWPVPFLSTLQQILGFIATPNLWKFTGSIGVIIGCSLCNNGSIFSYNFVKRSPCLAFLWNIEWFRERKRAKYVDNKVHWIYSNLNKNHLYNSNFITNNSGYRRTKQ